jgi:endonuclease/exonuclease/phosphatase family metal-dependent hydrolase
VPLLEGRSFIVGGDLRAALSSSVATCEAYGDEQQTFLGRTKFAYQNDHVFVSRDLAPSVVSCEVADRGSRSDHSPLVLTLATSQAG